MSVTLTQPPVDDPRSLYGSAPPRTLDQRHEALRRANDTRSRRAQLKRDLKAGRERADALLAAPPRWVDTMKVIDLLIAAPRIGRQKAAVMLAEVRASPSKTIGGLSVRQRAELVALVRAPSYPTMRGGTR